MGSGFIVALVVGVATLSYGLFTIYTADIDSFTKFVWFFGTWSAINSVLIIYLIYRIEGKRQRKPILKKRKRRKAQSALLIFVIILFIILMAFFLLNAIQLNP